jgi:ketosteroid isomerase-like protein
MKMESDTEKKEIAKTFLTALRSRDWDMLRILMTEDIVWSLPGESLISGEARGTDAVLQRAQTIVRFGVTFTLKHILIGQSGVALSLNNTAKRNTLNLDQHLATICSLRDGRISRIDTYLSDVDMLNAFFV